MILQMRFPSSRRTRAIMRISSKALSSTPKIGVILIRAKIICLTLLHLHLSDAFSLDMSRGENENPCWWNDTPSTHTAATHAYTPPTTRTAFIYIRITYIIIIYSIDVLYMCFIYSQIYMDFSVERFCTLAHAALSPFVRVTHSSFPSLWKCFNSR